MTEGLWYDDPELEMSEDAVIAARAKDTEDSEEPRWC